MEPILSEDEHEGESDLGDGLTVVSVLDYAHYAVPAGVK